MFKHILLPLDGSDLAEAALAASVELATCFDGQITLLRVVQPALITASMGGSVYLDMLDDLENHASEEAYTYLGSLQASLQRRGIKVQIKVTVGSAVAEKILETAISCNVDTIVMSTHGRGGISRWVFGSVADKVLRQSPVPVVLIRARDGDT